MTHTYESPVQATVAGRLATALTAEGFVVAEGAHDLRRTVEVLGLDGRHLVVVPLPPLLEHDPHAREADKWTVGVRSADGKLDDGWDAPFGGHSACDVTAAGQDTEVALAWVQHQLTALAEHGFTPAEGVRPGAPASRYDPLPYPGERPAGSWVVDHDALLWPVTPDSAAPSGWSVVERPRAGRAACLDEWLRTQGAASMASRLPVLSYGSNASPAKFVSNSVSLPGVNLRAQVHDLASVYSADTRRRDGAVPATLAALPGHVEDHVVSYVVPEDFPMLDGVEGRVGRHYDLVALATGRVVLADRTEPARVLAYVGGLPGRFPLRTGRGDLLLVGAVSQSEALAALGQRTDALEPTPLGAVWPLEVAVTSEVGPDWPVHA